MLGAGEGTGDDEIRSEGGESRGEKLCLLLASHAQLPIAVESGLADAFGLAMAHDDDLHGISPDGALAMNMLAVKSPSATAAMAPTFEVKR